ncbi:unnamed protein product [Triticum aestivum]|uniref:Ubiquitin-like protease family profile domain-containing protein n=1 Tax=Triticum aestivum TaxID=4565 RepID=A0A7H4LMG4_WHEAT|nr:unnamed protein product [Triticum aestivum]
MYWLADHTRSNAVFKYKNKVIQIRREMVNQVFGIQSGSEPFPTESNDPAVDAKVKALSDKYKSGIRTIPIDNIVKMMKNDETEEGFICSFLFLFISTVLCPITGNYANWKLLYGLHDISKLHNYDLASYCINHLNEEIESFHENLFNIVEIDLNDPIWVGGCLPMLVLRDISTTPYGARPLALVEDTGFNAKQGTLPTGPPEDVGLKSSNQPEVVQVISEVVAKHDELWRKSHEEHMSRMRADWASNVSSIIPSTNSMMANTTAPPVIISQYQGTIATQPTVDNNNQEMLSMVVTKHDDLLKKVHEEHAMAAVSQDQQLDKNNIIFHSSPTVLEDDIDVGKSIGHSELGLPQKDCSSMRVVPDTEHGITLAMGYADGTTSGNDARSMPSDVNETKPAVDKFYQKYLNYKFFKGNPTVLYFNDLTVSYEKFYNGLKPIGKVNDEVMDAYVAVFNHENLNPDPKSKKPSKFSFPTHFTTKLLVEPAKFSTRSCLREFKRINTGNNLHKRDLLFLPRVNSFHWTFFCVKNLFETINFFDSANSVNADELNILTTNLITNLSTLFKASKCSFKNIEEFVKFSPENYPKQPNLHDCAIYGTLYMDCWNGKDMKDFE